MSRWYDIDGVDYHYNGDMSDPSLTYKGITFNAYDVEDALQQNLDDAIEEGIVPEGTTLKDYLSNPENQFVATDLLDDWIFTAQTQEQIAAMQQGVSEYFDDNIKPEIVRMAVDDLIDIASISTEKLTTIRDQIAEVQGTAPESVLSDDAIQQMDAQDIFDFLENTEADTLLAVAEENGVQICQHYAVMLQSSYIFKDIESDDRLIELMKSLEMNRDGVYAVAVGVQGIVFSDAINANASQKLTEELNHPAQDEKQSKQSAKKKDDLER